MSFCIKRLSAHLTYRWYISSRMQHVVELYAILEKAIVCSLFFIILFNYIEETVELR